MIGEGIGIGDRVGDELFGFVLAERFEPEECRAGDERGVDGEERVLRGRADECDEPALDIREQDILLGFGEAVDLVEEQDRPLSRIAEDAVRVVDDLADPLDTNRRGVLADESPGGRSGDDLREGGLAGARRAVENDGSERVGVDHPFQEFAFREEVGLPDNLIEGSRADTRGQWLDGFECGITVRFPEIAHTGIVRVLASEKKIGSDCRYTIFDIFVNLGDH